MIKILPSILASDWNRLAEEVAAVEAGGADILHLDVMDGSFVPPITFGTQFILNVKKLTKLPLDVHLMIHEPWNHIAAFCDTGASNVTIHFETDPNIHRTLNEIKKRGVKAGVAINPGTPVSALNALLDTIDLALIMSVNPGWGGQKFIQSSLKKISELKNLRIENKSTCNFVIEVDGGINRETAKSSISAGAEYLVVGSSIFGTKDYIEAINQLKI